MRAQLRSVKMTLFGHRDDAEFAAMSAVMHACAARYASLLRVFVSAVSHAAAFDELSCRADASPAGSRVQVWWQPPTVNSDDGSEVVFPSQLLPMATAAELELFFERHFLGKKFALSATLESAPAPCDSGVVVRPFLVETLRTASYLVGDRSTGVAAIVDPGHRAQHYIDEAKSLGLRIAFVLRTGIPGDFVSGWPELLRLLGPETQLVDSCRGNEVTVLSPALQLTRLLTPGVSQDACCFLLQRTTAISPEGPTPAACVAAFTGDTMGVDCPGPIDIVDPCHTSQSFADRVAQLHGSLQRILAVTTSDTIVMPQHGGYNNYTHALDLAWAAHVGDMRRSNVHFFEALASPWATLLEAFIRGLLPTAVPMSRGLLRARNAIQDGETPPSIGATRPVKWSSDDLTFFVARGTHVKAALDVAAPLVLDCREKELYFGSSRVRHSLSVPCSPAGCNAELWLSAILHPGQPLVVVYSGGASECDAVLDRLAAVGCEQSIIAAVSHTALLAAAPSGLSTWFAHGSIGDAVSIETLSGYGETEAALSNPQSVVIDVRSPYEFRNGSQVESFHLPLTDLRLLAIRSADPNAATLASTAVLGGDDVFDRCFGSATDATNVVMYCAAGYRSHIAQSIVFQVLLLRADTVRENIGAPAAATKWHRVMHLDGGALQIMTRHADQWVVKDRSVLCVS
jgi:glyoxylase-like metal-dependent hydrolase (beta-lactamase superfamily II)/rhodanese-related sulfurtransferase